MKTNIKSLVLVLTGSIYGVMLFVSTICSAASYPRESFTPLATDLSMNQYKLTDVGDIITKGPWVDVRAYGAKGDGITDDKTVIQAAINTNLPVYFPPPSVAYLISGGLTVSTSGQTLFGNGARSIIRAANTSFNMITVQGFAKGVQIRDIQLQGAATDNTTGQYGIMTSDTAPPTEVKIENVFFSGESGTKGLNNAIKIDSGADDSMITGCLVENLQGSVSGTGYGVLASAVKRLSVTNCRFLGSSGRGRHAVYFGSGVTYSIAANNIVESFQEAHLTMNAYSYHAANAFNILTGNLCRGGGQNNSDGLISIFGKANNNKIISNLLDSSNANGIVIHAASTTSTDNEIVGNTIANSELIGISIVGATRTRIVGNVVHESSLSQPGTYSNIRLVTDGTAAVDKTVILGNTSTGVNSRSPFQINPTVPVPTNTVVKGNHFPPLITGVELNGIATALDGRIRYSQVWDPPNLVNGSSATLGIGISGADQGDIVTVGFTSNIDGCQLTGYASGTNSVTVIMTNNSGATKDVVSGTLYVDVWKREP